jgi:hypothetical protein
MTKKRKFHMRTCHAQLTEQDASGGWRLYVGADGSVYIESQSRPRGRFETVIRLSADDIGLLLGLAEAIGVAYVARDPRSWCDEVTP